MSAPSVIAVTGLRAPGIVGLVERVARWAAAPTVIGIGRRPPEPLPARVEFCELDLTASDADVKLAELLDKHDCELLLHAAFAASPWPSAAEQHELEVLGSVNVMSALGASRTRRLVVTSSAEVYGARADGPSYLDEEQPLRPLPHAAQAGDRAEVEHLLRTFAARHRDRSVAVLRPCWIAGPGIDTFPLRYLSAARVTLPLGHDPLMQFLHVDDWVAALEAVVRADAAGVYNVAGEGVLPLSTLVRLGGARIRRRPRRWLALRPEPVPIGFLDQLTYSWLVDTRRARVGLGFRPLYSTREAWLSAGLARQLESYA